MNDRLDYSVDTEISTPDIERLLVSLEKNGKEVFSQTFMNILAFEFVLTAECGGQLDERTQDVIDEAYRLESAGEPESKIAAKLRTIPDVRDRIVDSSYDRQNEPTKNKSPS
jgi:hypothetical protein